MVNDDPLPAGDTTLNDIVEVATAPQGATVVFANRVHNDGNSTDTFNITLSGSTFPVGTSFQLFQSDGNTPLVDSTGDGIPDTGAVAAGAVYTVMVKAVLPPGATGGPYTVTVTGTSTVNPAVSDATTDRLGAITVNTVDVTNDAAWPSGSGSGSGPEVNPVTTLTVNPGTTTNFALYVNNLSVVADSYNLAASTDPTFSSVTVPAGWVVTFKKAGLPVINTGVLAPSNSVAITAEVVVPANAAAGDVALYFRALSPTTGAQDIKHDRVTVNAIHALTVEPDNSGQVVAGGTVTYTHTVCNLGNISENVTLTATNSAAGWTTVLYLDSNSNGVLDSGDAVYGSALTVAAGDCARIFAKVFAPSGAAVGAANTTTVTGDTGTGAVDIATDNSTVIASDISLLKEQALDANCDGTPDTAYGTANLTTGAIPGACLRYRITVRNNGATARHQRPRVRHDPGLHDPPRRRQRAGHRGRHGRHLHRAGRWQRRVVRLQRRHVGRRRDGDHHVRRAD